MIAQVSDEVIDAALAEAKIFPFWLDNPARPEPEPKLAEDIEADLAIVGGGFTGLWAAIQAKEHDPSLKVVLIEADRIAFGASGRPGGIISTSIMHGLKNAVRVFPDDLAELERLGKENLDGFRETIERHDIDADLEWNGEMTAAVSDDAIPELREEFELHRQHGHNVEFLEGEALRREINSPVFRAAMWSHERSGTVQPAKLAWGLKRAALALGVEIYEHTPLRTLKSQGGGLIITTPEASIRADRVLLGTNAWAAGHPSIRRRVITMRDHVLATEPLTDEQLARVGWKSRQGLYDNRTELNYFRLTKENRIVFGGSVGYHYAGNTDPESDKHLDTYRGLARDFFDKFPQLSDVRFTHVWGGPIDYCTRYSMFFQQLYGGKAVYVGGYTGFGVGGTRFGARIGVALLLGQDLPELKLDIVRKLPTWVPPEPFRWIGAQITLYVLKDVDTKGGWRRGWINLITRLGFPIG